MEEILDDLVEFFRERVKIWEKDGDGEDGDSVWITWIYHEHNSS